MGIMWVLLLTWIIIRSLPSWVDLEKEVGNAWALKAKVWYAQFEGYPSMVELESDDRREWYAESSNNGGRPHRQCEKCCIQDLLIC